MFESHFVHFRSLFQEHYSNTVHVVFWFSMFMSLYTDPYCNLLHNNLDIWQEHIVAFISP